MRSGWQRAAGMVVSLGLAAPLGCAGRDAALDEPVLGEALRQPAVVASQVVTAAAPQALCAPLEVELPEIPVGGEDPAVPEIVAPERLAPFFRRAATLLRGNADDHVRIAVYGDSNLTMDHLTGAMRRWLQQRYGDAGHGFVALGRPWSHYLHMDVRHGVGEGFASYACSTDPIYDNIYGISGIVAESAFGGAKTWVATADESSPIGHTASRFELFYLRGPRWGTFDVFLDDQRVRTIDSHAAVLSLGVERLEVADSPHRLTVQATDRRRRVRLFGATLERGKPSFVVDSFGVGAMNTASQGREDPRINRQMLAQRRYDLVVFATGANDVFTLDVTPGHLKNIIAYHREVLPDTPILILTPSDRGKDRTFPPTLAAVAQRRVIAEDNGCALWDQFTAMGGPNAMKRLKQRGLVLFDYIHLNEAGGRYLGERLLYALFRGMRRYLEQHPEAGCDLYGASDARGTAKPAD